jgi:SAM-dependent methyltransferase
MKTKHQSYFMEHHHEGLRLANKMDPQYVIDKYLRDYIPTHPIIFLDVGCGPGTLCKALCKQYSGSFFHCLDISLDRLKQAKTKAKPIFCTQGDILSLPYQTNSFDIVFSRFIFEYMTDHNTAIKEMIRVCKKGGLLIIQDLDGQLLFHYPEFSDLTERMNLMIHYLSDNYGFDPFMGRKLYYLCVKNGLTNIQVNIEPYHVICGKISTSDLNNWQQKLSALLPKMEKALNSLQKAIQLKNDCLAYLQHEDTLLYSILFSVSAIKPEK